MKLMIKTVAALALLMTLAGCAATRSVVDLDYKSTSAKSTTASAAPTPAAPLDASAPAVKIAAVEDQRVFLIDPPKPELPSLRDNDINDKAVTSRAIARKRNTYGHAMGDVLLPEGDSVIAHITRALTAGFNQAGYRVLAKDDAGYDGAPAATVLIKQYWCWGQPGFVEYKLNCIVDIALSGDLPPLKLQPTIHDQVYIGVQIATDSDWRQINNMALQSISKKLAELLKKTG